jgi:hypothetical protein
MRDKSAAIAVCALLALSCHRSTEVRGADEFSNADGALFLIGDEQTIVLASTAGACDRLRGGPLREGALVVKLPGAQPGQYVVPKDGATNHARVAGAYLRAPQQNDACVGDILLASDGSVTLSQTSSGGGARGSFDLWFGSTRHLTGRFEVRPCAVPESVQACY